jgi:hypothetical protein
MMETYQRLDFFVSDGRIGHWVSDFPLANQQFEIELCSKHHCPVSASKVEAFAATRPRGAGRHFHGS